MNTQMDAQMNTQMNKLVDQFIDSTTIDYNETIGMNSDGKIVKVEPQSTSLGGYLSWLSGASKDGKQMDERSVRLAEAILQANAKEGSNPTSKANFLDVLVKLSANEGAGAQGMDLRTLPKGTLESELEITKKKLEEAKNDYEELQRRYTKIASNKLTANNPNVADLSDENRATKLAEKMSGIYDNEWTDAFEEIINSTGTEEQAIKALRSILHESLEEVVKPINDRRNQLISLLGFESYEKFYSEHKDMHDKFKEALDKNKT